MATKQNVWQLVTVFSFHRKGCACKKTQQDAIQRQKMPLAEHHFQHWNGQTGAKTPPLEDAVANADSGLIHFPL